MNDNKTFENLSISEKQSDVEIAMDLVSKYYLIKDSIFVRFQRKTKEKILQKAENLIHTITYPVAKRLLMTIIKQ